MGWALAVAERKLMASERRRDNRAARRAEGHGPADQRKDGPPILADGAEDRIPGFAPVVNVWPVLHASRRSLPSPLTDFVGREREIVALAGLLRDTRLVTLTGAGGIGKTRLAQRVAGEIASDFGDGVCWVDLVALDDPRLIPSAIAQSLGVREGPVRPLREGLTDFLRRRHLLLVVDNCEHLLEGCAALIEALLRAAPDLRVLATSRHVLGLHGETNWAVPPLSLPDSGPGASSRDSLPKSAPSRACSDRRPGGSSCSARKRSGRPAS
jgi:hypothetical protein